jgi:hypothetical protein
MLKPELLPGISKVPGFRGSFLLRRGAGDEIEFITIIIWDSLDSLRAIGGPKYEVAIIPEDHRACRDCVLTSAKILMPLSCGVR